MWTGPSPETADPVGGTGPQPISMINMGPAHQHRCHQRQHLATRIRSSRAISQPYVQQLFQTQPGHQGARYKQPRVGNQRPVIEHHPQPVNIIRYPVHKKCLLCLGDSSYWLLLFSQVREALHRINPPPTTKPTGGSRLKHKRCYSPIDREKIANLVKKYRRFTHCQYSKLV